MYLKYVIKTDAQVFRLDHVILMHSPWNLHFSLRLPAVQVSASQLYDSLNTLSAESCVGFHCLVGCTVRAADGIDTNTSVWLEQEKMDFSELSERISTCVNIRNRLRSRIICDCEKHGARNAQNNVSVVQESNGMLTSEPPIMKLAPYFSQCCFVTNTLFWWRKNIHRVC